RRDGRFEAIRPADSAGDRDPDISDLAMSEAGLRIASGNRVMSVRDDQLHELVRLPGAARSLYPEGELLWVGSLGGVYRVQGEERRFLKLPTEVASATVGHLLRAQGRLWAGTSAGLFWLEGD